MAMVYKMDWLLFAGSSKVLVLNDSSIRLWSITLRSYDRTQCAWSKVIGSSLEDGLILKS